MRGRGVDYIAKRLAFAFVTLLVALTLNFLLFRAVPGDAVSGLRCQHCTVQFKEAIRNEYGLDKPKWQQYLVYMGNLAHGDLGTSVVSQKPVWEQIKQPLLYTMPMILAGTVISILLGIVTGVLAAWRRGTIADSGNVWPALTFYAAPTQWLGLLVIFYLATPLGLPAAGVVSPDLGVLSEPSFVTYWWDRTQHLLLPALTLGLGLYGEYTLIVRTSMLETLGEDYVLTARAKGLRNFAIVWRHGLRNAMLPLITLIALSFGYIVAGAIVVEDVFSYPGIGTLTIDAIQARDYALLEGIFLLLTVSVILANLLADLLYFALDPRVTE